MNGVTAAAPGPTALFWRVKLRLGVNYLRDMKRHILLHATVGVFVLFFMLVGGFFLFNYIFEFLIHPDRQPFGTPLLKRLVGMVLLAFFSMLTFSNFIIMLTTSYISREVEFFMGQPIGHRQLFFCKLGESTIYSSWAFVILSMPFFVAYGHSAVPQASIWFYPITALLVIPYILIPSAIGSIATLILTVYFPVKKAFRLALALGGIAVVMAFLTGRFVDLSGGRSREGITRVMNFMGVGDMPWMPSTWLARGMRACLEQRWSEVFFWWAMLASSALMALQVAYWLAGPLYYSGFCTSKSSGTTERRRSGGLFKFFDVIVHPLRPAIRALVVKDLTVFWRDPAQWGQLMVLFGLLFIYLINLGSAAELQRIRTLPMFQSLISLFNIGATCFVLSILSTRFFYPMLSLEGKQQWVIGLAPLARTRLVWVKFGVCWASSLLLVMPLILYSCAALRVERQILLLSIFTAFVMSLGLTSLAIGLGALMPNFSEDNPSRIANGLGGTINVIVSLIYIGVTIVLEAPAVIFYIQETQPVSRLAQILVRGSIPAWILIQLLVIFVPMRLGLGRWRKLEF